MSNKNDFLHLTKVMSMVFVLLFISITLMSNNWVEALSYASAVVIGASTFLWFLIRPLCQKDTK